MKNKIYYKVLTDNKKSVMHGHLPGGFSLTYEENKWTKPVKGTKCFVFKSKVDACNFSGFGNIIYTCKVRNPRKCQRIVETMGLYYKLLEYLKAKKFHKTRLYLTQSPPDGTIECDAVKILEKL